MSVLTLRPNADSTPLELTIYPASPATHYDKVDESTPEAPDETDLVNCLATQQQTQTDIFGFPNHSSESGTINKVTVKCYCKYYLIGTDANNAYVNPSVKIGSTVYNSGDQALAASTTLYSYDWAKRPSDNADWSWTNIDDLLAGVKLTNHYIDKSNNKAVRCFQLWVEVTYGEAGASGHPTMKRWGGVPFMSLNKGVF